MRLSFVECRLGKGVVFRQPSECKLNKEDFLRKNLLLTGQRVSIKRRSLLLFSYFTDFTEKKQKGKSV